MSMADQIANVLPSLSKLNAWARLPAGIFLVGAVLFGAYKLGVRLNTTASLPLGLYIRTSAPSDYVTFCLDDWLGRMALERGYITAGTCSFGGTPLLKRIVARTGDVVRIDSAGLTVNGRLLPNTAPRVTDGQGRPMAVYPYGTYRVLPGTFWADSTYDVRSFGARYFGPVEERRVLMYVRPLLTF